LESPVDIQLQETFPMALLERVKFLGFAIFWWRGNIRDFLSVSYANCRLSDNWWNVNVCKL